MNDDANQSSLLPSSSTVCSAERPTAMVKIPAQSPSLRRPSCIGLCSKVSASAVTITIVGSTLTKKIVCQP